ncbi:MAG: hypothetical protein, partial [Olavius algarvensis Gamma 1 endosymbiont]
FVVGVWRRREVPKPWPRSGASAARTSCRPSAGR